MKLEKKSSIESKESLEGQARDARRRFMALASYKTHSSSQSAPNTPISSHIHYQPSDLRIELNLPRSVRYATTKMKRDECDPSK
jgi:hypothetical protein